VKILFLKITDDYDHLVPGIESIGKLFNFDTEVCSFTGFDKLKEHLCNGRPAKEQIDMVFVGAHSNMDLISNDNLGTETLSWKEFADHLCGCDGITDKTKIYLGCCDGGFKNIALTLMSRCPKIYSVSGVPCVLNTKQSPLAFHALLYGLSINADDQHIARMVTAAIGLSFNIHSRIEMLGELAAIETVQALYWAQGKLKDVDLQFVQTPFELDKP